MLIRCHQSVQCNSEERSANHANENCGGVRGYEYLLSVIQDKTHPEREEMLEWVEDDFDPEFFDREKANARIEGIWNSDA